MDWVWQISVWGNGKGKKMSKGSPLELQIMTSDMSFIENLNFKLVKYLAEILI